jgi:hypothetical protein
MGITGQEDGPHARSPADPGHELVKEHIAFRVVVMSLVRGRPHGDDQFVLPQAQLLQEAGRRLEFGDIDIFFDPAVVEDPIDL